MARWKDRDAELQRLRRRMRAEARIDGFDQLWIDLCWCRTCEEYVWHIEWAQEATRDGYVSDCPDCGTRLEVIDREGRGVRLH